jgi:hypothetical protein
MSAIDEFLKAFLSEEPGNLEFDEWNTLAKAGADDVTRLRAELALHYEIAESNEKCTEHIIAQNNENYAALQEAIGHLVELETCESNYRAAHDARSDGSIEAGRAWDYMRHSGDRAREWLAARPAKP